MTAEEEARLLKAYGRGAAAKRGPGLRETARDVGKTIESKMTRGVIGTPGAPADIARFGQMARDYIRSTNIGGPSQGTYEDVRKRRDAERERESYLKPSTLEKLGSEQFIKRVEPMAGGALTYEPTTPAGRAVALPAEMVGGAMGGMAIGGPNAAVRGAGALAGAVTRQGVVPGAMVAGAQALGVENPVLLGAIGMGAGAAAQGGRTRSAEEALERRMAGATPDHIQRAEELFRLGQQHNLPVSRANALDLVSGNRTAVSGLQRVLEGSGSPTLRQFYADAPERVQAAGGRALDPIGPVSENPSTIGPRASEAMKQNIRGTEQAVNAATRPAYEQFQNAEIPPGDFAPLLQNPLFMAEHQRIFADPRYAHVTQGVDPDSVQGVDITRRILRDAGQTLADPTNPNRDPTAATGYGTASEQAQEAASAGSRQALMTGQGQPSPLEATQQAQAQLREQYVDPLEAGPEGKVARSATTEQAQAEVFPRNPREGAHQEVGRMVSSMAQIDPGLASEFTRSYLGSEFAQAQRGAQSNASGYYGGAAFWKNIAGNPEQRASLHAALEALPNGAARSEVFNDITRIFEAMGQRERMGSPTAWNAEDIARLKESGFTDGAIKLLAGGGVKYPQKALDTWENWRLGSNRDEIASLLTDPTRGPDFEAIARTAPGSAGRVLQILRFAAGQTLTASSPASTLAREEEEATTRKEESRIKAGPR